MDENKEGAVRADKLPRLLRIRQSLLNIERLSILEGLADNEDWRKAIETMKKVLQKRSKAV